MELRNKKSFLFDIKLFTYSNSITMQDDFLNENYDEEIEDAFNLFDKDKNNRISAKELS